MKKMILLLGVAALGVVGCAHDREHVRHHDRYYVNEVQPDTVIVRQDGTRTYVREYEPYRGPHYQNNMEPRTRGKHAESLGWNTESYYRQRGYH